MGKRLTKREKAINARKYKQIRKVWEKTNKAVDYIHFKRTTLAKAVAGNLSIKEAAKKTANTEDFVSPAQRSRQNLINSFKENFKLEYDEIRKMSRNNKGEFISLKENLTWDKNLKGYTFNSGTATYFIDVSNSPESVEIYEI